MLPVKWVIVTVIGLLGVATLSLCIFLIIRHQRAKLYEELMDDTDDGFATCALEAGLLTKERARRICSKNSKHVCVQLNHYYPEPWALNLDHQFRTDLARTEPLIPKKIWRSVPENWAQVCQSPATETAALMTDWTQTCMTPTEQRAYITTNFQFQPNLIQLVEQIKSPQTLANLWRLLVAYKEGGLVLDGNMALVARPLLERNTAMLYVTRAPNQDDTEHLFDKGAMRHDLFLVSPKHPAILTAITQVCANLTNLQVHEDWRFMRLYRTNPELQEHRISCTTGSIPFSYHVLSNPSVTITGPNLGGAVVCKPDWGALACQTSEPSRVMTHAEYKEEEEYKVPAILHLSWISKDKVPQKVWDHLDTVVPSHYDIRFYSDQECSQYILDKYGPHVHKLYLDTPLGAHRADTFRYAILYHEGGVWMDIKTCPNVSIDKMFDRSVDFTTALTPTTGIVYQGVLSAAPRLAMLHECFFDSLRYGTVLTRLGRGYTANLDFMTQLLRRNATDSTIHIGYNPGTRFNFKLLNERVRAGGTDRYGVDSQTYDEHDVHVAKTRYDDFPWKNM